MQEFGSGIFRWYGMSPAGTLQVFRNEILQCTICGELQHAGILRGGQGLVADREH